MHPCEKCGEPVDDQYRLCYVCMMREKELKMSAANLVAGASRMRSSEQTPQNPYYTHPKYENAPERKETLSPLFYGPDVKAPSREEAIVKAHQENMMANQMLVDAILKLADAVRGAK